MSCLGFCGLASFAVGQTITFSPEDFGEPEWSLRMYSASATTLDNVNVTELHGKDWLQIARTGTTPIINGSAQLIYNAGHYTTGETTPIPTSVPTSDPSNQLADFSGSVILGWSTLGDSHGVLLRSRGYNFNNNATTGVINAYYLAATSSGLGLYYNVGNEFHSGVGVETLAHTAWTTTPGVLNPTNNNQYLLEFSAIGLTISGSLWATDGEGNIVGENPLASLSYLDTREEARTEGYFGLRGGRYGTVRSTYFGDLEISVIPEPSAIVFFAFASGLVLYRRRRF